MARVLKLRRGTTAEHATFTGAEGEVTVDITTDSLIVHDNVTVGGHRQASEAYVDAVVSNVSFNDIDTGNISITNNTISTTGTNQQLILDPNGTGRVFVDANLLITGNVIANADAFINDVNVNSGYTGGFRFYGADVIGLTGLFHINSNVQHTLSLIHNGVEYLSADMNGWVTANNIQVFNNLNVGGEADLPGNTYVGLRTTFPAAQANLQYAGDQNNFLQFVMQNKSTGINASTDMVATADNGDDSQGFINIGINGSNYSDPAFSITGPNDGYLYVHGIPNVGGNLSIGTTNANDIIFHTGGTTAANEIARFQHGQGLTVYGNITPGANVTYDLGAPGAEWNSLYVSGNTIYIGGTPLSIDNTGNLVVNGNTVSGGGGSVQPYLELTNDPFIIQPVILENPVTVTAPVSGQGATVDVVIGAGPVIDSLTINNAGSGYVVGQRYKVWYYNVGGQNGTPSNILFEIATVGASGEILTVNTPAFEGVADNVPATYSGVSIEMYSSVVDEISPGVVLTRGINQGLYNIAEELEYDNNSYASPLLTEWNGDGWTNLVGIGNRSFTTFRSALGGQVGNNIVSAELVMRDTTTDKYYKFDFSNWGQNNGGSYSYTRTEITDPNYFRKTDNGSEVDVIIPDDGAGAGVGITRAGNNGIYNPYREGSWDGDVTPSGTQWNLDGWDDLSDVETRTYTNFFAAYGNGGLGNKVPGSKAVMYVPDNGKYYAIQWLSWTQGGNGGGFSYVRNELDLTQLQQGVKFTDGTVLTSASGLGRVKSTASNGRRIEEAVGSNTVSVTAVTTVNITATASRSVVGDSRFWVSNTATDIAAIINDFNAFDVQSQDSIQFSLDNSTWNTYNGGYSGELGEIGVQCDGGPFTYNLGDTIYFRYDTGGAPVVWWSSADLPGGSAGFRGAVIDYHAYTGEATWIGTIHIVDDDNDENISHTEVSSGSTDSENDDLWVVTNEGTISYRRIDGEANTLKIHWTAKVFYGDETYD